MVATKHHPRFHLIGTNAEKGSYDTTNLPTGVIWIEPDTNNTYVYTGEGWSSLVGGLGLGIWDEDAFDLNFTDPKADLVWPSPLSLIDDWLGGFVVKHLPTDFESFAQLDDVMPSIFSGWSTIPLQAVRYNFYEHFMRLRTSVAQNGVLCMLLCNTIYDKSINAYLHAENNSVDLGLRYDNGSDDTFIEMVIRAGVGTYTPFSNALFSRWQEGGGGVTTTQLSDPFPPAFVRLELLTASGFPVTTFYIQGGFVTNYISTITFVGGWTPTRCGMFIRSNTGSGIKSGIFHNFSGKSR